MTRKILILLLIVFSGLVAGCSGSREGGDAASPGAAAKPAELVDIAYGAGIYDLEKSAEGSWRWVSDKGQIRLKNSKSDMKLKVVGSSPVDLIGSDSEITLKLNGEVLESVKLTKEKNGLDKEFTVPAARQTGDSSELTIESTKFFIPKQVYKNSTDDRKLSFSLTRLEWTAVK